MFKRLLVLFLTFAIFTLSASAKADTHFGLKAALNELHYSLTVEWDQKDQKFYAAEEAKFKKAVNKLIGEGLNYETYIKILGTELENERVAAEFKTLINNVSLSKMTTQEATEHIVALMKKDHAAGASWIGGLDTISVINFTVMVGLIIWAGIEFKKYTDGGGYI